MTNSKRVSWNHAAFSVALTLPHIATGDTFPINGPMTRGESVSEWRFSPSRDYIVYLADEYTDGTDELFSLQFVGETAHTKLNHRLVGN